MQTDFSSVRSKVTAASLLVALGIIYGDIGTSPLYVLKAIVGEKAIDEMLVFGGFSRFLHLDLQTTIKYIWLTLKADNDGEGDLFIVCPCAKVWQIPGHSHHSGCHHLISRWHHYSPHFCSLGSRGPHHH